MGAVNLIKNFDNALAAVSRETLVRAILGQTAQSHNEAALHDVVDSIPFVGDAASFRRIMTNKGNRLKQFGDAVIGIIPVLGDVADVLLFGDTNIEQFDENIAQDMGPIETVVTLKFIDNTIERVLGGNKDRKIWTD